MSGKKHLVSLAAVSVLMLSGASTVHADGSVPADALRSMGLSGLSMVSDADGMSVRGMGYVATKRRAKKLASSATVAGRSWASVSLDGHKADASAGTTNVYAASGKHEASGSNFSEAGLTKINTREVQFSDGTTASVSKIKSIHVFAGGASTAKAF